MKNLADVKIGIVAVSRDCFPIELSRTRREKVVAECKALKLPVAEITTVIESEKHIQSALDELKKVNANALVIFLGNFGPEGPETILAQKFHGPVMFCAAAEETQNNLINGRGDAYCGMLNASYNIGLRHLKVHIPEYPVGDAKDVAIMIQDFVPVARVLLSISKLKIFAFGPRPQDFLACNAPIKPLYDLGIEIMENSELDLLDIFNKAKGNSNIEKVAKEMATELGLNSPTEFLMRLAQYEICLTKFYQDNLGTSEFGIFAIKCWPSFESFFGFVPCYVNSRLAGKGIPVACEVDIYGALSEYMAYAATELPPTILDINNTVPKDMAASIKGYDLKDLFMGFHCGNTPSTCMKSCNLKYQLIMHRLLEPEKEPEITRGTLEGQLKSGAVTIFRLQSTADCQLRSYIAQGEILDVDPQSFGGIGVFAIKEMGRFYRHVLVGRKYPHHTAVAFAHVGKILFNVLRVIGIEEIAYNQPKGVLYKEENPFD